MGIRIEAGFAPRLPGRVRVGSHAYYRKAASKTAREGMAEVVKAYTALVRKLHGVTPEAVQNALMPVFEKSQEYVPKRTGTLAASGVLEVEGETGNVEGSITYGDADAWYASIVHEFVWLNHIPPTRAKYLQSAMEEELDSFLVSLAVDYATALG
jgi:hypothetical protein